MSGVDNRKQRGFKPQYSPGQYKGFGGDSGRKSSDNAPDREAGSGMNSGGIADGDPPESVRYGGNKSRT